MIGSKISHWINPAARGAIEGAAHHLEGLLAVSVKFFMSKFLGHADDPLVK
ncbi:MAG: hypothetical protein KAT34_12370 [Candidatus Aminicenantes bacterium]|nr:hypothetical protein [Candidatus Aminicenantes bacterium]